MVERAAGVRHSRSAPWRAAVSASASAASSADARVGERGEVALGVERRLAAGAGGGDGLPVGVVDEVAGGEHAVEVGVGAGAW